MLMRAATVVQRLCKSCRTCFKFYCMFYFTCDRSLNHKELDIVAQPSLSAARYIMYKSLFHHGHGHRSKTTKPNEML